MQSNIDTYADLQKAVFEKGKGFWDEITRKNERSLDNPSVFFFINGNETYESWALFDFNKKPNGMQVGHISPISFYPHKPSNKANGAFSVVELYKEKSIAIKCGNCDFVVNGTIGIHCDSAFINAGKLFLQELYISKKLSDLVRECECFGFPLFLGCACGWQKQTESFDKFKNSTDVRKSLERYFRAPVAPHFKMLMPMYNDRLQRFFFDHSLSVDERLSHFNSIFSQVCQSFAVAWNKLKFVHYDLHPGNILLDSLSTAEHGFAPVDPDSDRTNVKCTISYGDYEFHVSDFVAKIIDFGMSTIVDDYIKPLPKKVHDIVMPHIPHMIESLNSSDDFEMWYDEILRPYVSEIATDLGVLDEPLDLPEWLTVYDMFYWMDSDSSECVISSRNVLRLLIAILIDHPEDDEMLNAFLEKHPLTDTAIMCPKVVCVIHIYLKVFNWVLISHTDATEFILGAFPYILFQYFEFEEDGAIFLPENFLRDESVMEILQWTKKED